MKPKNSCFFFTFCPNWLNAECRVNATLRFLTCQLLTNLVWIQLHVQLVSLIKWWQKISYMNKIWNCTIYLSHCRTLSKCTQAFVSKRHTLIEVLPLLNHFVCSCIVPENCNYSIRTPWYMHIGLIAYMQEWPTKLRIGEYARTCSNQPYLGPYWKIP